MKLHFVLGVLGCLAIGAPAFADSPVITVGGDCAGSGRYSVNVTCTKIGGVAAAPSATTDTTNASNITSGTLPAGRLPAPSASTLGGVQSIASAAHNWIGYIDTSGIPHQAQPAATDVSGLASSATTDTTNAGNISSGTLAAGRLPAFTGDVTTSAGSSATTISSHAVTNAKAAQMAANTIKGNNAGSTANAADLTPLQAQAVLGRGATLYWQKSIALSTATGIATATIANNPGATSFLVRLNSYNVGGGADGYTSEYSEWEVDFSDYGGSYYTQVTQIGSSIKRSVNAGVISIATTLTISNSSGVLTFTVDPVFTGSSAGIVTSGTVTIQIEAIGSQGQTLTFAGL